VRIDLARLDGQCDPTLRGTVRGAAVTAKGFAAHARATGAVGVRVASAERSQSPAAASRPGPALRVCRAPRPGGGPADTAAAVVALFIAVDDAVAAGCVDLAREARESEQEIRRVAVRASLKRSPPSSWSAASSRERLSSRSAVAKHSRKWLKIAIAGSTAIREQ